MQNDNRWRNRGRHNDWQDENREGYHTDDRGLGRGQAYRNDEWQDTGGKGYNRNAPQSGYGSSMSSMGGGQGAYYPTEGGYMHDSRYADYGRDYRRYTDNYYRHHGDRSWDNQNLDSMRYTERERRMMQQPSYGQSYQSAYGDGGIGDHMGYGQKGAQYRDQFHGRYGATNYDEPGRGRRHGDYRQRNYDSRGGDDRSGYGDNQGYGTGRYSNRGMGSSSYFQNTNSDAYNHEDNYWNIGNYGERRMNESGYGYGDEDNRNRNTQNYTW